MRPVPGILPMVAALARQRRRAGSSWPRRPSTEARLVDGVEVDRRRDPGRGRGRGARPAVAARARGDAARHDLRTRRAAADRAAPAHGAASSRDADVPDLAEVRGQLEARRALEIALAGGHGMLMIGPPGRRQDAPGADDPGLLPPLDDAAALSVVDRGVGGRGGTGPRAPPPAARSARRITRCRTRRWSVAARASRRARSPAPTRASCSSTSSRNSIATCSRRCASRSRRGGSSIARAGRAMTFPARFQLIAAMNPCPCGFAGALPEGRCRCTPGDVERYGRRVSGPLRDRIDLWVTMPRMSAAAIVDDAGAGGLGGRSRAASRPRGLGPRSIAATPQRPVAWPGPPARLPAVAAGGGSRRRPRRGRAGDAGGARSGCCGSRARSPTWTVGERGAGPSRRGGLVSLAGDAHGRGVGVLMLGSGRAGRTGVEPEGPWRPASVAPTGPGSAHRSRRRPTRTRRNAMPGPVLTCAHGLGPIGFAALLARFGTGRAIVEIATGPSAVERLMATPGAQLDRADQRPDPCERRACDRRRCRARRCALARVRELGIRVVTVEEPAYPVALARWRCRRTCCSSPATRPPCRASGRSPSSGPAERRPLAGRTPAGSRQRWSPPTLRWCRGSRSASTGQRTRRPCERAG